MIIDSLFVETSCCIWDRIKLLPRGAKVTEKSGSASRGDLSGCRSAEWGRERGRSAAAFKVEQPSERLRLGEPVRATAPGAWGLPGSCVKVERPSVLSNEVLRHRAGGTRAAELPAHGRVRRDAPREEQCTWEDRRLRHFAVGIPR